MARAKVKLADNIARVVFIETDATIGATIGRDLKLPNGQVATVDSLRSLLGITTDDSGQTAQHHRLLQGLNLGDDHPQYTRKDTLTARGDLYVRGLTTVARLPLGTANQLLRSNGTDPTWVTISPVITLGGDLTGNVTLTNLGNGTLTATIANDAVTDAKLRNSAGLSVIGRSASTTGDPADIVAASDGGVLRRSGATVGFGNILSTVLTFTNTDRILGRDTAGGGASEELTISQVLDMIGSAARGDILYRTATTWARLGVGLDTYVLKSNGLDPIWGALPASSGGSLVYADGTVPSGNTVANTTTETAFESEYTVLTADMTEGTVIRIKAFGTYSADASPPTLRLRVKLNGTTILDTTAITTAASIVDKGWELEGTAIITSDGVSGDLEAQGRSTLSTGAKTADVVHLTNTAPVSVDMSADSPLIVTAQWGTADADNSITLRQLLAYIEAPPVALTLPIVALLHFDGADASTQMIDVTGKQWVRAGDAQLDTAQFKFGSSSLLLDGTGDHVDSMTDADFAFGTSDFTIECWVRFSALSGNNFVFTFGAGWGVYTFSGQWAVFDGASTDVIQGGSTSTGVWYHVALCRSGTNLRLFINGAQVGATATNSTNHTGTLIRLGAQPSGSGRMTGWIDEFRIVAQAMYTGAFTPPSAAFEDPDPTSFTSALLHLDGVDGSTTITDVKGKVWTRSGSAAIDTAQSKFGGASLEDPNATSYVSTPSHADFGYGTGDFTIEFWARPSSLTGSAQILYDQRTAGGQVVPTIYTVSGGDLRYHVNGSDRITAAGGTLATGNWHHIAVCRFGGVTKMFVNGTQVGSGYTDANNYVTSRVLVGNAGDAPGGSFGFIGHTDELRISKGHARYTQAFTPPDAAFPDI